MTKNSPMKHKLTFPPLLVMQFLFACNSSDKKQHQVNIDPVEISLGVFKVLLENEHVRVIRYSLQPGEKDEWHTHPAKSSYVVSGGKLKVFLENGQTIMVDEKTGTASWMDYVGKHYVEKYW